MDRKIRLGVVGLGHRGRHMFKLATAAFPSVEATAFCDLNGKLVEDFQRDFPDALAYTDFEEMLAGSGLNTLLVETPAHCHADFCLAARQRGLNVFSDIPSVASLAEAEALWQADQAAPGLFMTGANPNEWGFIEALCDIHRRGLLGRPFYLEAEYIHDCRYLWAETPWRRQNSTPIRYCTHSLGPLLRLLDEDLRTVSCLSTGAKVVGEEGQNDLMTAHFQTPSGVVVRFTASFINHAGCGHHAYRVFGTEGYFERLSARGAQKARTMLKTTQVYGMNQLTDLPIDEQRPEYAAESQQFSGHGGADYILWKRFVAAIGENAKTAPINLKDGLRMTLPGIFAAQSAEQRGQLTAITYPWD
jgi:predicted dehydrogenase